MSGLTAGDFPLPLTMSVPEAGRLLWGLGRDASYGAAERGEIPSQKVGSRLVVPTHAALSRLGMPDELIARTLGLGPAEDSGEAGLEAHPGVTPIRTLNGGDAA